MVSLAECAPCKAKRLQEESEAEFRKRYGFVNLTPPGWRPYMGQPTSTVSSKPPLSSDQVDEYVKNVGERMLWFGTGAIIGLPVGILANTAFKSLRRYREEAKTFVLLAAGVGMLAILLPVEKNEIQNIVARVSGLLMGSGLSDMVLPKKTDALAIVKG